MIRNIAEISAATQPRDGDANSRMRSLSRTMRLSLDAGMRVESPPCSTKRYASVPATGEARLPRLHRQRRLRHMTKTRASCLPSSPSTTTSSSGLFTIPLEVALPEAGPLIFGDGSRQLEVDTDNRGLREDFRDSFAEERAAGRKFLLQRETPVIPLSTAQGGGGAIAAAVLGNRRRPRRSL